MKLVHRYDYETTVSAKPEMTPEGFLKVMARATRVGVLKYKQADGTIVRELRHPDEVFNAESMASLAMKPLTNKHPKGLIDSESAAMHQVGMTGETVKVVDGKYLDVMTVITDKDTISAAEKGTQVQVSPGYRCELDFSPGIYNGEEYDAIQKNIRYNHLATVTKGRSGPEVCLRLDSDDALTVELNHQKEMTKMKMKLDGKDFEMDAELGNAMKAELNKAREPNEEMDSLKKDAKDSKKKIKEMEEEKEDAKKEKEKLQAKADGLESELKKLKETRQDASPADLKKAVSARIQLQKVAEAVGVEKFDEMDDLDLKKAVIKADSPEANLEGKSVDYVNARFDVAAESINAADAKARKLGEGVTSRTQSSEVMDAEASRQKMIDRQKAQWKGKEE